MNIKFGADDAFQRDIRSRVDRYFQHTGLSPRDSLRMYIKTMLLVGWLAASYLLLIFFPFNVWVALLEAFVLALAVAAVGFNIQHDGGHRSYSKNPAVNRWMARSLDLLGGSSYVWDHKHNRLHHTYANIDGHDDDISVGFLARLSPHQMRLPIHRVQQYYMWVLYAFLPLKWHVYDDFRQVLRGRIGEHRFTRPRGAELAVFLCGKIVFFTLAFVVPALLHPLWCVLLFYLFISAVQGLILSTVFQLAHVVEEAEFPQPNAEDNRMAHHWAVHQVETTVDFAPRNLLLTWYVGGLNYQVEHHLFPRICHVHYPRIARIVRNACRRHGIDYNVQPTLFGAIASHFTWLRRMGRPIHPEPAI